MAAASSAAGGGPTAPRKVAFHYAAVFPPDALRWYKRFDLLVTGAVLAGDPTRALRDRGPKSLLAYEWSTAMYAGEPASHREWESQVRAHNATWLLSPEPSGGASAAPGRSAFWYDFGHPEFRRRRAEWLSALLESSGYDGYFFDTVGSENLPPALLARFRERWPTLDYNACQGQFLAELRRLTGGRKLIFVNQGYRHAAHLLPHADLDLTESYFTAIETGRTRFRSWHDPKLPWESIRTPMQELVMTAAGQFPRVEFVHVNYATPDAAARAARFGWAVSRIWGHAGYTIVPDRHASERDEIYFTQTGAPLADSKTEGTVVYRRFERGTVAVNTASAAVRISETRQLVPGGPDGFFLIR